MVWMFVSPEIQMLESKLPKVMALVGGGFGSD